MRLVPLIIALLATGTAADDDERDEVQTLVSSERLVEGTVNWTTRTLTVYGEGVAPADMTHPVQRRLMGFRAAKLVAYRNLLDIVGQVIVDSRTTVSMAMVTSDSIRASVEGIVRGARVVHGSRQEDAGLYKLALTMPISGDFAEAVLPEHAELSGAADGMPPVGLPASDSLLIFTPPEPYTGLIVDARGLDLRPSMSPRLIDDTGRVIYDGSHVDRSYALEFGVVGYDRDIVRAAASERVGGERGHPFIVEAERVDGLFNGDVVISQDSGVRVLMADMDGDFLSQCRVTFVLGAKPAEVEASFLDSAMAANSTLVDSAEFAYDDFDEPLDAGDQDPR